MIGLSILLALVAYMGIAWAIVKRLSNKKARYVVIGIFVLIPTWDIVPGWVYLKYLCQTEGGIKIYKSVENVEGFRDTTTLGIVDDGLKKYGYKFIEGKNARYSLGSDGKVTKLDFDKPLSRYVIKGDESYKSLPLTLFKQERIILDEHTGEILATMKHLGSYGGWLKKTMSPLLGYGPSCVAEFRDDDFYLKTLKPVKLVK